MVSPLLQLVSMGTEGFYAWKTYELGHGCETNGVNNSDVCDYEGKASLVFFFLKSKSFRSSFTNSVTSAKGIHLFYQPVAAKFHHIKVKVMDSHGCHKI